MKHNPIIKYVTVRKGLRNLHEVTTVFNHIQNWKDYTHLDEVKDKNGIVAGKFCGSFFGTTILIYKF